MYVSLFACPVFTEFDMRMYAHTYVLSHGNLTCGLDGFLQGFNRRSFIEYSSDTRQMCLFLRHHIVFQYKLYFNVYW